MVTMSRPRNPNDLIRIEDAIKVLCRKTCHPGIACPDIYCKEMWELFEDVERVDAVPVRHGRLITHHEKVALLNGEAFGGVYCSECGYKTHNKLHLILGCPFKYCPNCGAKMDGKGNGNETD